MGPRRSRWLRWAAQPGARLLMGALALAAMAGRMEAADPPVSSRTLRAALILQLVNFVEWPQPSSGVTSVCVVGDELLATSLRQALDNQTALRRPQIVSLTGLKDFKESRECQVMAVGDYDERQVRAYLAAQQSRPVLTVGSGEEFLRQGGMVRFRLDDGRIAIEINMGPVERAKLRFSSKLLRLAHLVNLDKEGS
ncbi:MAG: YfiR family protein [Acidobacteria bacterium]|nr:YfiR family protein [Acidobacteriota bacterium]